MWLLLLPRVFKARENATPWCLYVASPSQRKKIIETRTSEIYTVILYESAFILVIFIQRWHHMSPVV